MKNTGNRSDCVKLERLQHAIDDCLCRDVPALEKQFRSLQRRCQQGQSIDRGLRCLTGDIERSIHCVAQRRVAAPSPIYPLSLPVVEKREHILDVISKNQVVVLCGETGSGKTTQLPKICLQLGRGISGKIGHTQPRRIAARSVAARIAEELQSPLGGHVGYKVRFQVHVQDSSYIKEMTDGMRTKDSINRTSDPNVWTIFAGPIRPGTALRSRPRRPPLPPFRVLKLAASDQGPRHQGGPRHPPGLVPFQPFSDPDQE